VRVPGATPAWLVEMIEESPEEMREEAARASIRRRRLVQTASTVHNPKSEPVRDAAKMVKTVSLVPRKAPIIAISLTSPNPMPSTPRARK